MVKSEHLFRRKYWTWINFNPSSLLKKAAFGRTTKTRPAYKTATKASAGRGLLI
jgi:hypothetical protein